MNIRLIDKFFTDSDCFVNSERAGSAGGSENPRGISYGKTRRTKGASKISLTQISHIDILTPSMCIDRWEFETRPLFSLIRSKSNLNKCWTVSCAKLKPANRPRLSRGWFTPRWKCFRGDEALGMRVKCILRRSGNIILKWDLWICIKNARQRIWMGKKLTRRQPAARLRICKRKSCALPFYYSFQRQGVKGCRHIKITDPPSITTLKPFVVYNVSCFQSRVSNTFE